MKKIEGNDILEYTDGEYLYVFDTKDKKCYKTKINMSDTLTIPTNGILDFGENKKTTSFEILKFVLSNDIDIHKEGFRNKEYYVIKQFNGEKIYIDKDTYFIQRTVLKGITKEYRVFDETVTYRDVQMPDISQYEVIEE